MLRYATEPAHPHKFIVYILKRCITLQSVPVKRLIKKGILWQQKDVKLKRFNKEKKPCNIAPSHPALNTWCGTSWGEKRSPWLPQPLHSSHKCVCQRGQSEKSLSLFGPSPLLCVHWEWLHRGSAKVPPFLVLHDGPVAAQHIHGVLPVPAGAAVVLEAGLAGPAQPEKRHVASYPGWAPPLPHHCHSLQWKPILHYCSITPPTAPSPQFGLPTISFLLNRKTLSLNEFLKQSKYLKS